MIWEIHQQAKIHRAEDSTRKAENKVDRVDHEIRDLRRHMDRLSLACQSMWELEGGKDFEAGQSRTFPPEAHPDDLSSKALGALFGGDLSLQDDVEFDMFAAL